MRRNGMSRLTLGLMAVLCFGGCASQALPICDPAVNAVQGSATLSTEGMAFCSEWGPLFAVPAGKRLVVEWVSATSHVMVGDVDPIQVTIRTWDGSDFVYHSLPRLEDSVRSGGSFFWKQTWVGTVRLYSEGGGSLEARMCPDAELTDETVGTVTFSGYLIDLP